MSVARESAPPALTFDDVSYAYGLTPAVDHVSFSVERGEFVALIGPNGSGKTTLIKLALGLERPQSGRVLLLGQAVERFTQWRRVGYVPQFVNAFSVRFPATVSEVVSHGLYRGLDPLALFRRSLSPGVERGLEQAGISELRNRLVSELSGGQQRRVLIARALVSGAELLVLDEPTTGLDQPGQEQLYALLRRLRGERGITILLVTHDLGVVLHEASRVACVNQRLFAYVPTQELTPSDLSKTYGTTVDLVVHQHE
ncbi:MAG: metal ABC transporter ATP-binding protein [Dehalococcoidia bacterium]|nr:metal ABC transporter ATP-binding protein [Dehalococcoidia bacterium]